MTNTSVEGNPALVWVESANCSNLFLHSAGGEFRYGTIAKRSNSDGYEIFVSGHIRARASTLEEAKTRLLFEADRYCRYAGYIPLSEAKGVEHYFPRWKVISWDEDKGDLGIFYENGIRVDYNSIKDDIDEDTFVELWEESSQELVAWGIPYNEDCGSFEASEGYGPTSWRDFVTLPSEFLAGYIFEMRKGESK